MTVTEGILLAISVAVFVYLASRCSGRNAAPRPQGNHGLAAATGRQPGVIVIVGGLIYFPMLILGPIGERFTG